MVKAKEAHNQGLGGSDKGQSSGALVKFYHSDVAPCALCYI